MDEKYSISIEKDTDDSSVVIKGTLPKNEVEASYQTIIEKERGNIEIKGFRKGKVPTDKIVEVLGENELFTRAAEQIIKMLYPTIILDNKLDPVGIPKLQFTKLAKGNDVDFEIKINVIEEFNLPDYKAIAKSEIPADKVDVTDEEVNVLINQIKSGFRGGKNLDEPFSDDELKKLGKFENIETFETHIKRNLKLEKDFQAKQKHRARIAKALVDKVDLKVPSILVDTRLSMMIDKLKFDSRRMGTTFEEYLNKENKTEEGMKTELEPRAVESVIFELILDRIAGEENVNVEDIEVASQLEMILKQNPKANEDYAKSYLKEELRRERTLDRLESYSLPKN